MRRISKLFAVIALAIAVGTAVTPASTSTGARATRLPRRVTLAAAKKAAPLPVSIASGAAHTCALYGGSSVKCWGDNRYGQLGNGDRSLAYSATPVAVGTYGSPLRGATQITAGDDFTCALVPPSTTVCWGNNGGGQLGLGGTQGVPSAAGDTEGVWVPSGNYVLLGRMLSIAAGGSHMCAVLADHTVECWGNNYFGELGNGTTTASVYPRPVKGLSGVASLSAWGSGTCALLIKGTVDCWGVNNEHQLGSTSFNLSSPVPLPVVGITDAVSIASFGEGSCALRSNHTVTCWGDNRVGQLGNGTQSTSYQLPPLTGSTTTIVTAPPSVVGLTTATAIAGGGGHVCAVLASHAVQCWGLGTMGQLGNGTTGFSTKPVTMSGITTAVQVSGNDYGTCVLLSTGGVKCMGANERGELGIGRVSNEPTSLPVSVVGL